jgi:hypothetical protein
LVFHVDTAPDPPPDDDGIAKSKRQVEVVQHGADNIVRTHRFKI